MHETIHLLKSHRPSNNFQYQLRFTLLLLQPLIRSLARHWLFLVMPWGKHSTRHHYYSIYEDIYNS